MVRVTRDKREITLKGRGCDDQIGIATRMAAAASVNPQPDRSVEDVIGDAQDN